MKVVTIKALYSPGRSLNGMSCWQTVVIPEITTQHITLKFILEITESNTPFGSSKNVFYLTEFALKEL